MKPHRKIAAHYILHPRCGLTPRAVLTFSADGTLLSLETGVENVDSLAGVEFYSGILIPGMVNCHTHLELSHMRGVIAPGRGLYGFLNDIKNLRHVDGEAVNPQEAASYHDSAMAREGVIAAGDISNGDTTFAIKRSSKIFYHTFVELFDTSGADVRAKIEAGERLVGEAASLGLEASLTPHSAYLVPEGLMKGIVEANRRSRRGRRLSIHFMESSDEADMFSRKGDFMKLYPREPDFLHHPSPAARLAATIPADTPLLLIHNTFAREQDVDIINGHFSDVTWVVCPLSNRYIENALPPLDMLRDKGCRIAIGTDSLSSNRSLSVLEEVKYIRENYDIPLAEILGWATLGGAEALGLDSYLGTFEPGKIPGAVVIDSTDAGMGCEAKMIL